MHYKNWYCVIVYAATATLIEARVPQKLLKINKQGSPKTTLNYRCHLKVSPYVTQRRLTVMHPTLNAAGDLHFMLGCNSCMLSHHQTCGRASTSAVLGKYYKLCHYSASGSNQLSLPHSSGNNQMLLPSYATQTLQGATIFHSWALPLFVPAVSSVSDCVEWKWRERVGEEEGNGEWGEGDGEWRERQVCKGSVLVSE